MANQWLRLWHDMPNDPKWRTIARVSKQPISLVKSVYLHLLVDSSQNKDRGLFSISTEDLSSALDAEDEDIRAILESMQGRVLNGKRLSGWQERQPALETGGDGNNSSSYGSNYVYYVSCRSTGLVKIGVSRNPWSRLKDLQTAAGSKYEMLASIKTDMRSEVEVHKLFSASRVRGEWFKYTEALSRVVDALKSKEIEDYASMIALISELPVAMFTTTVVATVETPTTTVATKDKDKDKDKDKEEIPPIPPKGACPPKTAVSLPAWLTMKKAAGDQPIPPTDAVFAYAEQAGITEEMLRLAWREFRDRYSQPDAKRYKDWRAVFAKSVRGNWHRLWRIDAGGGYVLTTEGLQAQKVQKSKLGAEA